MKKIFLILFFLFLPLRVSASLPADFAEINGEKIWMGWTAFESGTVGVKNEGYGKVESGSQVAYGRYQFHIGFDDLTEFMRRMVKTDASIYGGFQTFIDSSRPNNGSNPYFEKHKKELVSLWRNYANNGDERFSNIQDDVAYELYYVPTKKALLEQGISLEQFGSVVKGTVWSVAIRDGILYNSAPNSQTYKALVLNYSSGITDEEYIEKIMATQASKHSKDGSRWTSTQKSAALSAMKMEDSVTPSSPTYQGVGGVLGGSLEDPYPNIFGATNLKIEKGTSCQTIFLNASGELNDFGQFLKDVFGFVKILVPALVLILSTIDYFKSLSSSSEDAIKKANGRTIKRVAIGLILFFLPFLLELLFELFGLYDISNCGIS